MQHIISLHQNASLFSFGISAAATFSERWMKISYFPVASTCTVFTFHLPTTQVSAPQRAAIIHRKLRREQSLNFTFFNSLATISSADVIWEYLVPFFFLLLYFVFFLFANAVCYFVWKHPHADGKSSSSNIKVESLLYRHPRLSLS